MFRLLLNILNVFVVHARVPAATTSGAQPTEAVTTLPPKKTNGANMLYGSHGQAVVLDWLALAIGGFLALYMRLFSACLSVRLCAPL